jgi:hypothetical protein
MEHLDNRLDTYQGRGWTLDAAIRHATSLKTSILASAQAGV